ncbi:hypothetical protein CRYUN_Cryun23aG0149800 [Craigia yunnanensis]
MAAKDGGEVLPKLVLYSYWQSSCSWRVRFALNLKVEGDVVVSDSYAILMYLEEKHPQRTLLPADPQQKALNLQFFFYWLPALSALAYSLFICCQFCSGEIAEGFYWQICHRRRSIHGT